MKSIFCVSLWTFLSESRKNLEKENTLYFYFEAYKGRSGFFLKIYVIIKPDLTVCTILISILILLHDVICVKSRFEDNLLFICSLGTSEIRERGEEVPNFGHINNLHGSLNWREREEIDRRWGGGGRGQKS